MNRTFMLLHFLQFMLPTLQTVGDKGHTIQMSSIRYNNNIYNNIRCNNIMYNTMKDSFQYDPCTCDYIVQKSKTNNCSIALRQKRLTNHYFGHFHENFAADCLKAWCYVTDPATKVFTKFHSLVTMNTFYSSTLITSNL